jgi:hypothetical protein
MNKKNLITLLFLLISTTSIFAACPTSIVGGYVGYQTRVGFDPNNNVITNISNSVFVVSVDKNSMKITNNTHVSADSTEGLQQDMQKIMPYRYDKATCTARVWETSTGSSKSDVFFVVGNGGTILNGIQQDVGDNESKLFVLTKQ